MRVPRAAADTAPDSEPVARKREAAKDKPRGREAPPRETAAPESSSKQGNQRPPTRGQTVVTVPPTEAPPTGGQTVVTARAPEIQTAARERLTAATLRNRGGEDVAGALERVPGVQAEANSRGERLLIIRGFDQRQIPVYLDGVPLEIPYDGRLDLAKIPLGLLGGVDVLKGPGPLRLGPTGMGGAVRLKTRDPRRVSPFEVGLRGTAGGVEGDSVAAFRTGPLGVVLSAGWVHRAYYELPNSYGVQRNEDGGRRENSRRIGLSLGLNARLQVNQNHTLQLLGVGAYGSYGVPPSDKSFSPRYWRFPSYSFLTAAVSHRGRWSGRWWSHDRVYFGGYENVLVGFDDASYTGRQTDRGFRSTFHDTVVGVSTAHKVTLPRPDWLRRLSLIAYLDYRRDAHEQVFDEEANPPAVASNRADLSMEVSGWLGESHVVSLGLQNGVEVPEAVGKSRPKTAYGPGPLLSYTWSHRRGKVRGTLARRTRFPSLKERYSEAFGLKTPNPDLQAESAWQLLAEGDTAVTEWLQLSGALFGYLVDDIIDERPFGDGTLQQQNVGQALLAGGELGVRARFSFGLDLRLAYAYLYARRLEAQEGEPRELSGRTPHTVHFGLRYKPLDVLQLSTLLRVYGPTPAVDPDTGADETLDARIYLSAQVTLGPWHGASVYVRGTNLLDRLHETLPGFPEEGRTFWAGIRYRR